jgi:protein ImuB
MHLSPRPFWLLDPPEALPEVGGRPWRRGALRLLAGPERIESGWWEVGEMRGENEIFSDVRRDYFVAITADSRWAWVFRELRVPGGWYLHGWFS